MRITKERKIMKTKSCVDIIEIDGKLGIPLSQIMHTLADQIDNIEDISCEPITKDKITLSITFSMEFVKAFKNNKEKTDNINISDHDDKSLECWVKDKLYPTMKKLSERGIIPDIK